MYICVERSDNNLPLELQKNCIDRSCSIWSSSLTVIINFTVINSAVIIIFIYKVKFTVIIILLTKVVQQ